MNWYKPRTIIEAIRLHDGSLPQSCHPGTLERRLTCRRISQCLALAGERRWEAMSCAMCTVDDPQSREEMRQDMIGMANLLRAASL